MEKPNPRHARHIRFFFAYSLKLSMAEGGASTARRHPKGRTDQSALMSEAHRNLVQNGTLSVRIAQVFCTSFVTLWALMSLFDAYAKTLALLTGNAFQAEVCARLQSVILGFQTIPAKPQGDAGLDGFSHSGTQGYCCYGPEISSYRLGKSLEKAIVEKFKGDLRKVLELESVKKQLVCFDNAEMGTILPASAKLLHIDLIVNWFESHRVLGPIHSAFLEYKAASKLRFVHRDATMAILGPTQLANRWSVDELTVARAEQKNFYQSVQKSAATVTIDNPQSFDDKMALLRQIRPDQVSAIEALAERFLSKWRMSLAFEAKLNEAMPNLHHQLDISRGTIITRVAELMLASSAPWKELGTAGEIARKALDPHFRVAYGSMVDEISDGEIARLIGECSIGWTAPGAKDVN